MKAIFQRTFLEAHLLNRKVLKILARIPTHSL